MNMLMQASVAQAKSQLADLLRRAERGEDVVIARHGLPVARLVAIQRSGPPPVSAKPLDPKLYLDIDLDEPAFPSWEKGGHAPGSGCWRGLRSTGSSDLAYG